MRPTIPSHSSILSKWRSLLKRIQLEHAHYLYFFSSSIPRRNTERKGELMLNNTDFPIIKSLLIYTNTRKTKSLRNRREFPTELSNINTNENFRKNLYQRISLAITFSTEKVILHNSPNIIIVSSVQQCYHPKEKRIYI